MLVCKVDGRRQIAGHDVETLILRESVVGLNHVAKVKQTKGISTVVALVWTDAKTCVADFGAEVRLSNG